MSLMLLKYLKEMNKLKRLVTHTIPKHPVAGKNKLKAISRFIGNHLSFNNSLKAFDWFNDLRYYYKKGDASFSGNYFFGLAEWQESLFLAKYLISRDVFLDIGANHGHYVILASGFAGCHTYAVEPISGTFELLKKNIELNNLATKTNLLNIGLSDTESILYFSNDKGTMNKIVAEDYINKSSVPVKTLDGLGLKPNVIKIDVEGFEIDVLSGGKQTLLQKELNVVICEINFTLKKGVSGASIVHYMKDCGFDPYYFDGLTLIRLNSFNTETYNTIFIKDVELVKSRFLQSKPLEIWGVKLN